MSMTRKIIDPILSFSLALFALTGAAAVAGETEDAIATKLSAAIPQLQIEEVIESDASGLYEVNSSNGGTLFVTEDGQHLLTGDLLKITPDGIANLSEEKRLMQRVGTMDDYGLENVISYPAIGDQKASIAVFTDIDCPYCRKFHDEVPKLNELGITVNYYGFPRSGPNTPSFAKYVSVWCADDQQAAMDAAKQGRSLESKTCQNPVEAQYDLGRSVGVTGTPASVLDDGQIVPGYRPAEQLAEALGIL